VFVQKNQTRGMISQNRHFFSYSELTILFIMKKMQYLKISQKLCSELEKYNHEFTESYKNNMEFLENIEIKD
jgi:hypothetical protein